MRGCGAVPAGPTASGTRRDPSSGCQLLCASSCTRRRSHPGASFYLEDTRLPLTVCLEAGQTTARPSARRPCLSNGRTSVLSHPDSLPDVPPWAFLSFPLCARAHTRCYMLGFSLTFWSGQSWFPTQAGHTSSVRPVPSSLPHVALVPACPVQGCCVRSGLGNSAG